MWFLTDDERALLKICQDFAQKELAPKARECDEKEQFNIDAFRKLADIGVLGITADPEYGGAGMGALSATMVMQALGRVCPAFTLSYLAHSILCVNNIQNNASAEQKSKYLPKLINGEWVGCMGMSEPEHGSDAIGIQTKAVLKGDHYLLNGNKMWITNAQYADVAYVYTRTGPNKKDLTTFVIEKGTEGFSTSGPIHKMGMRASNTGELNFQNAKVPLGNRIGQEGDSTYHMMKNLDLERLTICGISLGIAEACVQQCQKYAGERKQFGKVIGSYQLIQKMLAEMSAETEMIRHFLYSACKEYDEAQTIGPVLAAQVKLTIPKLVTKIALDAIQLHGGYGYSREFPLERLMRDNKLMEIGAGTNEVMIMIIAKSLLKEALKGQE